jgi:hypothetical protein
MSGQTLPIVIGGFYRSGTTLVRRLFDSHSRISCGPEVKFFRDFYGEFAGDDLAFARFFRTVRALGLTDAECLGVFGPAFVRCHELAAEKLNKRRWADKAPENILYLQQWRALLPRGFMFVHVVRSPYDALASLTEIGFPRTVPASLEGKIALYLQYANLGLKFCNEYPDTSITISYEGLVRRPKLVLTAVLKRLEETFECEMLNMFHLPARRPGLEDPKVTQRSDIHAESIGRWREVLTPADHRRIGDAVRELPLNADGEWRVDCNGMIESNSSADAVRRAADGRARGG